MRRGAQAGIVAAVIAGLGVSSTLVAFASWVLPAQATSAQTVAGRMPRGATPTARLESGHARVSWEAQELRPGVRMRGYLVTAHDVDATPRPDVEHTVSTTSAVFTSSELSGGTWRWAIRPLFETWIGAEGRLSRKVGIPAPARTTVLAASPATPAAATMPASPGPARPSPAGPPASPSPSPAPDSPPAGAGATPAGSTPDGPPPPVESATPPPAPVVSPSSSSATAGE